MAQKVVLVDPELLGVLEDQQVQQILGLRDCRCILSCRCNRGDLAVPYFRVGQEGQEERVFLELLEVLLVPSLRAPL